MKNLEKYLSILTGDVDGLLLTSRYSRYYCAEYDIAEGVAIVSKNGCRYFTDSRYIEAAQNGIKEVFDVTILKLLVKQNRVFDEIQEDLPVFMQVLDSLCRKLFQFYWHTEKMEEKYGMTKLKSLEESLKVTLDSLSELTIFFKLRTVDGTGSTGDSLGDLMTGQML